MIDTAQPNMTECPSMDKLSAFADGLVADDELDSLWAHVETCEPCQVQLETLPTGRLEQDLNRALQGICPQPESDSREVDRLIAAVAPLASSGAPEHDRERPPATQVAPAAGDRFGQYRLVEELGRGGMGVVYKAEHVYMQRPVAVKFISVHRLGDPHFFERFHREVRLIAALDHPHIVRAYDAGEHDGQQYLVMELVDGIDLRSLLRRQGPFPVAEACEITRQVALGLEYLAENGMVHRDIKPSNLLLTGDGVVKIADLGLARLHVDDLTDGEVTETNVGLGSLDYAAPEQASNARSADIRSDLYSLGCTLFALLAGRPPFGDADHASAQAKLLAHASQAPPSLRTFRQDVPDGLHAILSRLMEKDKSRRFQSPGELVKALTPFLAGTGDIETRSVTGGVNAIAKEALPGRTGAQSTEFRGSGGDHRPDLGIWRSTAGKVVIGVAVAGVVGISGLGAYLSRSDHRPELGELLQTVTPRDVEWATNRDVGSWELVGDGRRIRVDSFDGYLVALGTYEGGNFEFSAKLQPIEWRGQIGLFFETVGQQDAYGAVEFATVEIEGALFPDARVVLKRYTVYDDPQRDPNSTLKSDRIGNGSEIEVAVQVADGRPALITVNGVPRPELSESWRAHVPDEVTLKGRIGIWCNQSSVEVSSLKFDGRDVRLISE